MRIGIPREVKTLEGRVGLVPAAVAELVGHGHTLLVEQGAGLASGYGDEAYRAAGASIVLTVSELYGGAQLIIKVKEPQPQELELLRADHLLFCFLHLAAEPALLTALLKIGVTAVAFETVSEGRTLPLLAPMSDIAGRIAAQNGAQLLQRPAGGKGVLLGGLPAAERGHVVVLGGGVVGGSATAMAAAMGARVTVFDRNRDKLAALRGLGGNVTGLYPYAETIDAAVREADLLIGAVLTPGARAPHLVSAAQVAAMQPGSVIIDVAVDQGGCIETTRPTSWAAPTFIHEGVVHFGVTNMPGAVPRSASQALSAALLPYALQLAAGEWNDALRAGVNVEAGRVVHPALRE
ncbi:MAG: alanine dehydrogenase [Gammaproteobacteria bacterium]|nr:alanine dehydrogenase [Gammaproteobacteria bacterium]